MAGRAGCCGVLMGVVLAAGAVCARADVVTSTNGSLFNPNAPAFAGSTGHLAPASGTITFNTDTGAITGLPGGTNVGANYYAVRSQSNQVELGLFVFDSISLPQGVTVTVTGNRGLVLASRGDFLLGSTLSVNGGNATNLSAAGTGAGGVGASGSEGGVARITLSSAPPGSNHGNGGKGGYGNTSGSTTAAEAGNGYGGGRPQLISSSTRGPAGGTGAGYGGSGARPSGLASTLAGSVYGDAPLSELFGGSGGSGAQYVTTTSSSPSASTFSVGGGGGGGGAIELISLGTLTLTGSLESRGGKGGGSSFATGTTLAGGGGSGGGIIVAANQIVLSGSVNASGGSAGTLTAGTTKAEGAGGGGGRVAFYYNTLAGSLGSQVSVAGGSGGLSSLNGASGTVHDAGAGSFPYQPVAGPELSSLTLAMLGAAPVLLGRKRRDSAR